MSDKKRYNGKRIVANILWSLLGFAAVILLGAAIEINESKRCKGVEIHISGVQNNFFIDKTEIELILQELCSGVLVGKKMGSFNLAAIENTLEKNLWIKNAELFFDNNEVLRVEVLEREPVARIFTRSGSSFYLDSTLTCLPLSDRSTARVPVFSNFPSEVTSINKADSNLLNSIKNVSNYILHNDFWMAQIEQVDITSMNTFEMVPKVGNQIILFGTADNYREKFSNLLTFYKQVGSKVGWNTYSKINVQYKNQVVAVKRGTEDVIQDLLRTKQLMESIVANAQRLANDSIKNIQLVQQQDDNIIPVAPRVEDIPDEQPIVEFPKTAVTDPDSHRDVTTDPSSTEKPNAILSSPVVTEKVNVPDKKLSVSTTKPFWLPSATVKPNSTKRTLSKSNSLSIEKSNPIPFKKEVGLKATKTITKSPGKKTTTKPPTKKIVKSATKQITKPKAVMPPPNDY